MASGFSVMDGSAFNLRLFRDGSDGHSAVDAAADADQPGPQPADPRVLAGRELLRPPTAARGKQEPDPLTPDWFDHLDRKRYARHGAWLPAALEFDRHPGESVLILGPGVGTDAVSYLRHGSCVTVALTDDDHPDAVRRNLDRLGRAARLVPVPPAGLPFADGEFDVAALNALHLPLADRPDLTDELYRVLKPGGKLIGMFPARYDAGYWQDFFLPLQHLYWRRPADPTTGRKFTARQLREQFAQFAAHRVGKRQLRRGELPHFWRVLPLSVLERAIGRVLVLKAFKPLSAAHESAPPVDPRLSAAA